MKNVISQRMIFPWIVLSSLSGGLAFAASGNLIEVPVEALMAPYLGYDDNDSVQIVVHGHLPNACYQLANATTSVEPSGAIRIHQFALRKTDGICAEGSELPPQMLMQIPFTNDVEVGRLSEGNHAFSFLKDNDTIGTRGVYVEKAVVSSVDNAPYAAMSSALAKDLFNGTENVKVTVGGSLNSTCSELAGIEIKKVDDVFVLLPKLKFKTGVMCIQTLIPFIQTVDLGKNAPGNYLAHIRSMNGKSLNKYFSVSK